MDTQAPGGYTSILDRPRFGPSAATGLVGMKENVLLSDYLGVASFLPVTSASAIRSAMMRILTRGERHQPRADPTRRIGAGWADRRSVSSSRWAGVSGRTRTVDAGVGANASNCIFWCSIAAGGLLRGQPLSSVTRYIRSAEAALQMCDEDSLEDAIRAEAAMSFVYRLYSENEECRIACIQRALEMIQHLKAGRPEEGKLKAVELLMRQTPSRELCEGRRDNLRDIQGHYGQFPADLPHTMDDFSEEGIFVYASRFEITVIQALMRDAAGAAAKVASSRAVGNEGGMRGPQLLSDPQASKGKRLPNDAIRQVLHDYRPAIQQLEKIANRPWTRLSIGALMIHIPLLVTRTVTGDTEGSLRGIRQCLEVLEGHPGLCRLKGLHPFYVLSSLLLAVVEDHVTYRKLAAWYDASRPTGAACMPPMQERSAVRVCDHSNCRLTEGFVLEQHSPLRSPCSGDTPSLPVGFPMGYCAKDRHAEPPDREVPREPHVGRRTCSRPPGAPGDAATRPELPQAACLADNSGRRYPAAADVIEVEDWRYARDALSA